MSLGDTAVASEPAQQGANGPPAIADPALKHVQDVLASEIGVATLLNRLKQSISSAKEFAHFLKKRSVLEEEHAQGLRKVCKMSADNLHKPDKDIRQDTFMRAFEDMMRIHERMAENGVQFAMSLHQMHEDLLELCAIADKSRKGWKQNGLAAEQRVADIENAVRKSQAKYHALADEYDRARTGDPAAGKGGKMFGFKGPKSAAQHEEDLLRKVQVADQDYHSKVQTLQTERGELIARTRPEAIKALQDLIRECDSGLALQMQKFASFNEKLLLSNGLCISPLKGQGGDASWKSMRDAVGAIHNDDDLKTYISQHHSQVPPNTGEPKYERHPVLNSPQGVPTQFGQMPQYPMGGPGRDGTSGSPLQQHPPSMGSRTGSFAAESPISAPKGHGFGPGSGSGLMLGQRPSSQQQQIQQMQRHERSFSHSSIPSGTNAAGHQPQFAPRNSGQQQAMPSSRFNLSMGSQQPSPPPLGTASPQALRSSSQGPPQLGALPFQTPQSPQASPQGQQGPPPLGLGSSVPGPQSGPPPPSGPMQPRTQPRTQSPPRQAAMPSKPVFGLSLSRLYERDALAVPMVVYQCIQAVDLYGLTVEGIYRLSGSVHHVNKLKSMFDTDSTSDKLDFRNPENFFHDVNSVAGLLKQFFRDLPDPLLTREHYNGLIEAAKHDDDIVRRDSLHAIINNLPDPNYATLRALTLHLYRVMDNSGTNRMNSQNLAIVFGPTLLGTAPGANIADAGWQVRVVDTILQNTYQIFDDD